jgi:hypothetical protein
MLLERHHRILLLLAILIPESLLHRTVCCLCHLHLQCSLTIQSNADLFSFGLGRLESLFICPFPILQRSINLTLSDEGSTGFTIIRPGPLLSSIDRIMDFSSRINPADSRETRAMFNIYCYIGSAPADALTGWSRTRRIIGILQ